MDPEKGNGDALPPPPPVPEDVVPMKAEPEKKKVMRVPMGRRGLATRGNKVQLLTNHFKVNVSNVDGHFFHYSVCYFFVTFIKVLIGVRHFLVCLSFNQKKLAENEAFLIKSFNIFQNFFLLLFSSSSAPIYFGHNLSKKKHFVFLFDWQLSPLGPNFIHNFHHLFFVLSEIFS